MGSLHPSTFRAAWRVVCATGVLSVPLRGGATDPAREWNTVLNVFAHERLAGRPATQAHLFAVTHTAMHQASAMFPAVSGIEPSDARHAAMTEAAFRVSEALAPSASRPFRALRDAQLAGLPAGDRQAGIEAGARAAQAVLRRRSGDGWPEVEPLRDSAGALLSADIRRVTAPAVVGRTFVLSDVRQFAPELPFWVTAGGDIVPVESLRQNHLLDLPPEAGDELLQFWQGSPVVNWNALANAMVRARPSTPERTARLFQRLNCALADGLAVVLYWRATYEAGTNLSVKVAVPIERLHPSLGPEAEGHATAPQMAVPIPVRNYPARGAVLAGAAEVVLTWFAAGDQIALAPMGGRAPPAVREGTSWSALARGAAGAAVLNEKTSREAGVSGYRLGLEIGRFIVQRGT